MLVLHPFTDTVACRVSRRTDRPKVSFSYPELQGKSITESTTRYGRHMQQYASSRSCAITPGLDVTALTYLTTILDQWSAL